VKILRDRMSVRSAVAVASTFEKASFQAEFRGAKVNNIGGVDMLIRIPPQDKWQALSLADAAEMMVQMDVRRVDGDPDL
jgi:hypothetical protein